VAQWALDDLERRTGATAGLILVDPAGRVGLAHTSETMVAAWRSDDTTRTVVMP
jgi:isoaspartyl peptidase/L-asparaginase-like protein (Ntn-hydrolase superfamily)